MALTSHKAIDLLRYGRRLERGGAGIEKSSSAGAAPAALETNLAQLIDRERHCKFGGTDGVQSIVFDVQGAAT
jgi:hypothetical protein